MNANYLKVWLTSILLILGASRSSLVLGQVDSWSNPNSGIGKWETNSNWSLSSPPTSSQAAFITNTANLASGSRSRTVEIDPVTVSTLGSPIYVGDLIISGFGSGSGATHNSLFLNNVGTNSQLNITDALTITANGTLNITNSSLFVANDLYIDNTVLFNGGLLQTYVPDPNCPFSCFPTGADTYIGYNGVGAFTMSGGEWESGAVELGTSLTTYGTLTVSGGSVTMDAAASLPFGLMVVNGTVWLKGGSLKSDDNPQIGYGGVGQMIVSNGMWSVDSSEVDIGIGSTGSVTIAGGVALLGGCFLGSDANGVGLIWQTGGQLNISGLVLGGNNVGQMTISNGIAYTSNVELGSASGSSGVLTVAGGSFNVYMAMDVAFDCTATGVVNVTGGSLFVTNAAHNAVLDLESGTVTLSGGTLCVDKLILTNSCGHFVQTGGALVVGGVTNVPASFQITAISREANNMRITWTDVAGHTDIVQVINGSAGNYTTNFTDLSPQLVLPGFGNVMTNFLDLGGATNKPARYYRVRQVP